MPREATIDILKQLDARGGGGAICYAAGYTEVGGEGVALHEEFTKAAGDLAVVGPNCYGLLNFIDGICLWPTGALGHQVETGCAIVMQSGNIALNLSRNDRSVPFAYVISSGNQAILNAADYVDALADDPKVTAIGLYLEGIKDVPAFSRAAAKALQRGKPLVALKAGNSELGAKFAMSHTGSLAGSDKMYDALFERLGIIRVHSRAAAAGDAEAGLDRRPAQGRPAGGVHLLRRRMPADGRSVRRARHPAARLLPRTRRTICARSCRTSRPSPTRSTTTPRSGGTRIC